MTLYVIKQEHTFNLVKEMIRRFCLFCNLGFDMFETHKGFAAATYY